MNKTKNVLFLVTGMTPAVITETIWALACDPHLDENEHWIPDKVHVLSTERGINEIKARLLEDNVFEKFKRDYPQLSHIQFDINCLDSIKDANGNALSDLRTPGDNEYAADEIHERIRQLTQNDNISLHVSIAGGRKTMGFYAGYALSLHGRAQDRLSHVLVEENFEFIPDFFYPTPTTHFVTDRNNQTWDASTAQIWLAKIPFVRMKEAIKKEHQINTSSFTETVRQINQSNDEVHLSIDIKNKTIIINKNNDFKIEDLQAKPFAFLCLFADDRQKNGTGIIAPTRNLSKDKCTPEETALIHELTVKFKTFYSKLREEDYIDGLEIDVDKDYLNEAKSQLKKQLQARLPLELASKLEIIQDKKRQPFYLDINPESIEFI